VRNIETLGASVAIIFEDRDESLEELVMSDDGTGGGIKIPSILIGKKDGKKL
jgi:hypothetical protein